MVYNYYYLYFTIIKNNINISNYHYYHLINLPLISLYRNNLYFFHQNHFYFILKDFYSFILFHFLILSFIVFHIIIIQFLFMDFNFFIPLNYSNLYEIINFVIPFVIHLINYHFIRKFNSLN